MGFTAKIRGRVIELAIARLHSALGLFQITCKVQYFTANETLKDMCVID